MERFLKIVKIGLVSIVIGLAVGLLVSLFALALFWCNSFRATRQWLVLLLPFGGLFILAIHHAAKVDNPGGTNLVIERMHEKKYVRWVMTPLIFVSTLVSQFFGASIGREAAALQIGGSFGSTIGRLFKVPDSDSPIIIISGMSAAFSALFGTPMAACVFALEIEKGRVSTPQAILPAAISALIARVIAGFLNVPFLIAELNTSLPFNLETTGIVCFFGLCCAAASVIFSQSIKYTKVLYKKLSKSKILPILWSSLIIIAGTYLVGDQTYNGAGTETILACLTNTSLRLAWYVCVLKFLFTCISLGGGFQGGEIIPALFVGATFGNFYAQIFSVDVVVFAALGMIGMFCGITKCPLASLLLAVELFGFVNPEYFLLVVGISLIASGKFRIYSQQQLGFLERIW